MQQVRKDLTLQLNQLTSNELNVFLDNIITTKDDGLSLSHLRGGAKSLTVPELKKELAIYHRLAPWHTQINDVVDRLNLSLKNRQHFSGLIDYYGSKVRRFKRSQQHLWLLCHLTERMQLGVLRPSPRNRHQNDDGQMNALFVNSSKNCQIIKNRHR